MDWSHVVAAHRYVNSHGNRVLRCPTCGHEMPMPAPEQMADWHLQQTAPKHCGERMMIGYEQAGA